MNDVYKYMRMDNSMMDASFKGMKLGLIIGLIFLVALTVYLLINCFEVGVILGSVFLGIILIVVVVNLLICR